MFVAKSCDVNEGLCVLECCNNTYGQAALFGGLEDEGRKIVKYAETVKLYYYASPICAALCFLGKHSCCPTLGRKLDRQELGMFLQFGAQDIERISQLLRKPRTKLANKSNHCTSTTLPARTLLSIHFIRHKHGFLNTKRQLWVHRYSAVNPCLSCKTYRLDRIGKHGVFHGIQPEETHGIRLHLDCMRNCETHTSEVLGGDRGQGRVGRDSPGGC